MLTWVVHPFVENRKRSVLLIAFLVLILALVYLSTKSIYIVLLSVFFFGVGLYKYFVPFHYQFDQRKIVVLSFLYRFEKKWESFRSFYADSNGVLLSPFERPSRLENFRGLYIQFGAHREEVINFINQKVPEKPASIKH